MSGILVRLKTGSRPTTAEELAQWLAQGAVTPEMRIVSMDDGATWCTVAEALKTAAPTRGPNLDFDEGPTGSPVNGWYAFPTRRVTSFVALAKKAWAARLFEKSVGFHDTVGHIATVMAGALGIVAAITIAIKTDSFSSFGAFFASAVGLIFLQYVAARILDENHSLVRQTENPIRSDAVLNVLGLAAVIIGVYLCFGGIREGVRAESLYDALIAVAWLYLLLHVALLCFNPGLTSTKTEPGINAGQEAVGVLSFCLKVTARLSSVAYGFLGAVAVVGLLVNLINLFRGEDFAGTEGIALYLGVGFVAALLPVAIYVGYLLQYLLLAVIQAIFMMSEGILRMSRK